MRSPKRLVGGAALMGLGALLTVGAMRVHFSFDHPAQAAPPAAMSPALPPPSPTQIADARAFSRTFAQVAEQLKPSVVAILVEKGGGKAPGHTSIRRFHNGRQMPQQMPQGEEFGDNPFSGTPFERFFGMPFGGDDGDGEMRMPKQTGAGSGVVIDPRGYILTNNHVVEGADVIKVKFADGHEVKGTITGTDPKTDLAVVKVDAGKLVAAKLGDSEKLEVGEWVIAIGNPYGLDHTVTVGVISAKGRGIGAGPYEDYLQTDAAINPGNSGGPLVSLDGEVVGINTAIRGIGTMIGFSIPSAMARPIVAQLIESGHVRRPYIGISMQNLSPELAAGLGPNAPQKGALVGKVEPGSPAGRAGVQAGDVIVTVDGREAGSSLAVQKAVLQKKLGDKVTLGVWRGGSNVQLVATTAELPGDGMHKLAGNDAEGGKPKIGVELQSLTPQIAEQLGVKEKHGAVVSSVLPNSAAAEAGIQQGDVIVEVDRRPIVSAEEATNVLRAPRQGGHLLRILRGDGALFMVVPAA
jgi:serine protease Do